MAKVQANPKDVATLMALADEFYAGGQFETSATWLDKLLAIDPEHIQGLLARGAVYFNLNDLANAESTWKKVAVLEPDNVEVHYDLGFLYLNQRDPRLGRRPGGVEQGHRARPDARSWPRPCRSHLDSLVKASMMPGASAGASAAPAAAPRRAAPASAPAASPAADVIDQGAKDLAFTTDKLSAPAGSPFTIRFDNQDAAPARHRHQGRVGRRGVQGRPDHRPEDRGLRGPGAGRGHLHVRPAPSTRT